MGRLTLIARLVARDLRHRPGEAVLLLLAITAATATLTLGLVLHGVDQQPVQRTQAATQRSGRGREQRVPHGPNCPDLLAPGAEGWPPRRSAGRTRSPRPRCGRTAIRLA